MTRASSTSTTRRSSGTQLTLTRSGMPSARSTSRTNNVMYLKRQKIGGANQIHVVFSFSICFGLSEHYAVFSMPLFLSFNPGMLGIYLDIFVKLKCVHIKTHKCQGNHCIDCT